ncbi:MAG: lipoprotein-releasing ABC transporter ATP-binding protein LolD [Deltaproteobacteria bacterium]|nr:lipoprotein-releasing ABC transporter ATP-binding protein LolD [Deltaproteobacteria bacterium]
MVRVEALTKHYVHGSRQLEVLKGIELEIARGEMLSVVGMSGAGKSTLLHVLGTIDLPSSGRIVFSGRDLSTLSSRQLADFRNRQIGFVFQFHHLLPEFTALENVMMPVLIARQPRSEARQRAEQLLEQVGLTERMSHRPGELSGGEQQRVALARALVMSPALLLADEPTGNLDTKTGAGVHELFFELNRQTGASMIVVTHNLELARQMPRALTMADGRLTHDTLQPSKESN